MAHFAKIDENNVVIQIVVVDNKDTSDANSVEKEYIGAAYLERILGGTWKQTSYNGNFRKNYAGIGYTYREDIDAFVPPKPFPSWVLNQQALWDPPIPYPDNYGMPGTNYRWDEATLSWRNDTPETSIQEV